MVESINFCICQYAGVGNLSKSDLWNSRDKAWLDETQERRGDERVQTVYANNACEGCAVEEYRYISEPDASVLLFVASMR